MSTILEKASGAQGKNESVHYFKPTILSVDYNDNWLFSLPEMATLMGLDVMLAT